MYRMLKTVSSAAAACVLLAAIGCSDGPNAPTAPTVGANGSADASADGSTLKAFPPTATSPKGDERLSTRKPTLIATNTTGKYVNSSFAYEFQLTNDAGALVRSTTLPGGAGTTTWAYPDDLDRDTPYRWRVRATLEGSVGPWSTVARFFTVKENRTPNPAPGQKLPLPNMYSTVTKVVNDNPGILSKKRSCQDAAYGGDPVTGWEFMDKTVDALRLVDSRWGYNGKRGNANDPSVDVVDYNYGNQPDEGTTNVYIIDILGGHCGSDPSPSWIDNTAVTINSGTIGRWISRGRFPGSSGIQ